jgi:hypothetical protein
MTYMLLSVSELCSTLEKSYVFHTTSDEKDFYMKLVALNEIYNFLILRFSFKIVKMLKK